jgi:hypothetical protein
MWLDFLGALRTGAETHYTLDMAQRDLRMVELCRTQRREVSEMPKARRVHRLLDVHPEHGAG